MPQECQVLRENKVKNMCFHDGYLYTSDFDAEERDYTGSKVSVYSGINEDNLILLDTLDTEGAIGKPSVDQHTGKVYLPNSGRGVCVVRYDGSKLIRLATLSCVQYPTTVAVVSTDALYVCDRYEDIVCLVDVNQDRVTAKLEAPRELSSRIPNHIAVLGDTILVSYSGPNLVIYRHGITTPDKMIPHPEELRSVSALSTDNRQCFLVTEQFENSVYVLDISGKLIRAIPIPVTGARDCIVADEQLFVVTEFKGIIKLLQNCNISVDSFKRTVLSPTEFLDISTDYSDYQGVSYSPKVGRRRAWWLL